MGIYLNKNIGNCDLPRAKETAAPPKQSQNITMIALGSIALLGGLFFVLSASNVLPFGINAITQNTLEVHLLGGALLGGGMFAMSYGSIKEKQRAHASKNVRNQISSSKFEHYKRVLEQANQLSHPRQFRIPERRVCNFGGVIQMGLIDAAKKGIFITDQQIVKRHEMKFLPSPFLKKELSEEELQLGKELPDHAMWKEATEYLEKQRDAIGVSKNGKHIFLQQAVRSCVPTCVSMLLKDYGVEPDYALMEDVDLASQEDAAEWVKQAGLNPKITQFSDRKRIQETLNECLKKHGPGTLSITHPEIGGHNIVLDEIRGSTATIRDPMHGWMVTVKLDTLLSWIQPNDDYFLQIVK